MERNVPSPASVSPPVAFPSWRHLNGYHCYVFALAALGWMFDAMDQQIFTNSRSITLTELLPHAGEARINQVGGYVTSAFIAGWACGGLLFGVLGDKWGRVKTMAVTILIYAGFTGLSAWSPDWEIFGLCRFLTGLGVGGEFAVGAALVAEVMPTPVRAHALGLMQALAAVGTILAAWLLGAVVPHWGWEGLYYLGALPALVAVLVFGSLREPAKWVAAKAAARAAGNGADRHFGALSELFTDARWRRRSLVGAALGLSGIIGLWGAVYWSPELIDTAIPTLEIATRPKVVAWLQAAPDRRAAAAQALQPVEAEQVARLLEKTFWPGQKLAPEAALARALTPGEVATMTTLVQHTVTNVEKTQIKSKALMLQQVGSFFGVLAFTIFAARFGRRRAFLIALLMAWASVVTTFYGFREPGQIWFFYPWLGFGALAVFGGYAIYFPELFPTRLRSTGTGFCYNVSRFAAIVGPLAMGALAQSLEGESSVPAFRLAAIIMASAYFIGIVALIWAPETRGQSLPEEDASAAV